MWKIGGNKIFIFFLQALNAIFHHSANRPLPSVKYLNYFMKHFNKIGQN